MSAKGYEAPPDAKPWERQSGEGVKEWAYFQVYRDMGPTRSLTKLAQQYGYSKYPFKRSSAKNRWVSRAQAWDNELDKQARESQIEEIKLMRKQHADAAHGMLTKAVKALLSLPVDEMKANDIVHMIETAVKIERMSRGDAGEVVEERVGEAAPPVVQFYMPENHRDEEDEVVE